MSGKNNNLIYAGIAGLIILAIVGIAMMMKGENKDEKMMSKNNSSMSMMASSMNMMSKSQMSSMMPATTTLVGGVAMFASKDIIANVVNAPNLTTLVTAVKAADLVTTLQSAGPFTVFGPTNDAFNKLPTGTVETLVKPENKATLTGILTYHVVSGKYLSTDLKDGQILTTVQGETIKVSKANNKIMLTDAKGGVSTIEIADVLQSNGVAHVVDTVLMPSK